MENYYDILNVDRHADDRQISSAYKKLALKLHPDKSSSLDASKFHQLQTAYNLLMDPSSRQALDRWLDTKLAAKQRVRVMDKEKLKMRTTLLQQERQARKQREEEAESERKLAREIERLRKKGTWEQGKSAEFKTPSNSAAKDDNFVISLSAPGMRSIGEYFPKASRIVPLANSHFSVCFRDGFDAVEAMENKKNLPFERMVWQSASPPPPQSSNTMKRNESLADLENKVLLKMEMAAKKRKN